MTTTSIVAFGQFLIQHQQHFFDDMRIADYGGTEGIGADLIKKILSDGGLENYNMLDFDNGIDLREPIRGEKFDLGICMDLLEHTSNPFLVARNIMDSLNTGAYFFITVPFVWPIHAFPDDYWRFTPHGVTELFKEMEAITVYAVLDTYEPTEEDKECVTETLECSPPYSRIIGIFKKKQDDRK